MVYSDISYSIYILESGYIHGEKFSSRAAVTCFLKVWAVEKSEKKKNVKR